MAYPEVPVSWLVTRNVAERGKNVAIRYLDHETGMELGTYTYETLVRESTALASRLRELGIAPGDRIALFLPNSPQLVFAFYGVWLAGAVVVPCNPMLKQEELRYQMADSGARLLIADKSLQPVAERTARELSVPFFLLQTEIPPERDEGWRELVGQSPTVCLEDRSTSGGRINPRRDLAVILYTGGTTGTPKGAMLSHWNIVVNTIQFATWYAFEPDSEVCISVLPLCHSGGMSGAMNVPLYSGGTLLLFRRFHAEMVLRTIQRYRATRFFGVPTMYVGILNVPGGERYDLSSLRACRTNAAPLPPAVKAAFDARVGRATLVEGYGLTETSPLTHANPIGRAKPGSIGIPLPDTDARIVDPDTGEELAQGLEGELCIRGPQVMLGYWGKPAETGAVLVDGWFRTGDIARQDDEGYFYIVDRKKDVIISSGFKVWPREVEEVLYDHPAVKLVAVIGIPDPYRGEAVKAIVVPRDEWFGRVKSEELVDFCRSRLANYKVPRIIEFARELPMSGAGKILRRVLRERHQPSTSAT